MNGNSGNQPVQSLDRDCCLERSTMHTIGGTLMGAETCYVAAKRMVIRKDWGHHPEGMVHPEVEQWEIPEHIKTVEEVRRYIAQHPPVRQERHDLDWDFDLFHESIHVAGGGHVGSETRFLANERIVVSRKWGATPHGPQDPDRKIWVIPDYITTEAELRQYIRATPPVCPRKPVKEVAESGYTSTLGGNAGGGFAGTAWTPPVNELDKDCYLEGLNKSLVWKNPETGEWERGGLETLIHYRASDRMVTFRERGLTAEGPVDSGERRWILPAHIVTREDALHYIRTNTPIGESPSGKAPVTPPPPPERDELDHDIGLHFKSVSAKNAHAGSRTEYQAAKRQVVHSSWCTTVRGFWIFKKTRQVKHEPEILPVPESIRTEEALREYVKGKKPLWL